MVRIPFENTKIRFFFKISTNYYNYSIKIEIVCCSYNSCEIALRFGAKRLFY